MEHFLANAGERACAVKRGGGCQWVFLDDDAAEACYQLEASEGLTAEKLFVAQWAAAGESQRGGFEGGYHYRLATHPDGTPMELGRGAMGITFKAFDTVLGNAVALKVIDARIAAHPEARERFLREARAAARIRHPNVASVFYYGTRKDDAQCFYAMELVEGETLAARLQRSGRQPPALALEIVAQASRALVALEAHGLVHRDLKPANVMLCPFFYEYPESLPDVDYWEQIPDAAGFDIVICIRWSRLGRSSAPALRMPDDTEAGSYTEQEIAWALDHAAKSGGTPSLHVYRNRSQPTPPLEPKEDREAFVREWDGSQAFFTRWEKSSEENFASVCHNYWNLQGFEQLFREHFRSFLVSKLDREAGHKVLGRGVRRWKTCPFRGLSFFDFEHAPIFHGRTKAIGEVLEALEAQVRAHEPFVLIIGSSGSGKSSLMRAGVLPLLTQPETIDGVELWRWR